MAITQQQYSDALFGASLTDMDSTIALINLEKGGCSADWSTVLCDEMVTSSGMFCFTQADYTSVNSVKTYNQLLGIAGLNYNSGTATDPNAQGTSVIIVDGGTSYTPPAPDIATITAGSTVIPFTYIYTGARTIQYAYLEQNMGGGNYIFAPNAQLERNGNLFTIVVPTDGSNLALDSFRLTIILA